MKEHINLFQPDILEGKPAGGPPRGRWLAIFFLALLLTLVGFYAQGVRERGALAKEVEAMIRQRDQLHRQLAALASDSFSMNKNVIADSGLQSILKERIPWSRVLREVSLVAPDGVWMTQFETDPTQGVRFEGFAMSYQKVTDLISALESSKIFQDVLLDFSRQNQSERRIDFSIHAHVRKGAWIDAEEG